MDFESKARDITDWATQVADMSQSYGSQLGVYISNALSQAYEAGINEASVECHSSNCGALCGFRKESDGTTFKVSA